MVPIFVPHLHLIFNGRNCNIVTINSVSFCGKGVLGRAGIDFFHFNGIAMLHTVILQIFVSDFRGSSNRSLMVTALVN
jgi:hypothetical protein